MNRRHFISAAAATAIVPVSVSLSGCTSSDLAKAQQMVTVAEAAVDSIVTILTTASGLGYLTAASLTAVSAVFAEIKVGLAVVGQYLATEQASPSSGVLDKIDTALTAIQTNIASALTLAGITDSASQAVFVGTVGLLKSAVALIQTFIPAAPTASAYRKAAQIKFKARKAAPLSPDQFVNLFNAVVVNSQYANAQIK